MLATEKDAQDSELTKRLAERRARKAALTN